MCSSRCARAALRLHAQSKSAVVEEIVARVNNDIITLSDYQKSRCTLAPGNRAGLPGAARQTKCMAEYKDRQKDLLRDLIDQHLLIERAKDMGISVETDLVKRLDEVRKQNNLATHGGARKGGRGSRDRLGRLQDLSCATIFLRRK